jgi:glycosyltransferase involved in cell wall biosynthesis
MNFFLLPVIAWAAATIRRKPLVVDYLFSIWDAYVKDRARFRSISLGAAVCYLSDILATRLADHILVDTQQHRLFFSARFGVGPAKQSIVYVGADPELFYPRNAKPRQSSLFQVVFIGSFLPLHGIEVILQAAQLVGDRIRFRIYGTGPTHAKMASLVRDLSLSNVLLPGHVPQVDIPDIYQSADVVLGIFGTTPKTTRVIPHKVFQGLAMGRPVITSDTPAIREIFIPDTHLVACAQGDAASLAASIRRLADDDSLRKSVASEGSELVRTRYSPSQLGKDLVGVIEGLAG